MFAIQVPGEIHENIPKEGEIVERLTEKVIGCFEYDLKDHKHETGEFNSYDAFFDYNMAVRQLGKYEDIGLVSEDIEKLKRQRDIYKENWIKQLNAMLAEFDKDGWCRLVMKKEDVLQMKKEMETDYGIFGD